MSGIEDRESWIAVIGLAGRYAGAEDLPGFWRRLVAGDDCVTRFPATASGRVPGYGVVDGADLFDAAFFGYSPREALMLDPQHRVFLECAWEALEHSGYDPGGYPGVVGVYGGSGDTGHFTTLWANRSRLPGVSEWQLRLASGADFLTSRVAYKLGLTGPAVTVQTACSTSLVAVHTAVQALLAGECDLALAGGVTLRVPFIPEQEDSDDGVLSPDGSCRAFDADAAGTVAGDGAGIVVLKRLDEALADGDHIHAVIRGSAVNNDGAAKVGFTAPSVEGQAAAVRAAHQIAGVDAADIDYVEAHGTGTPIGDPIEVRALTLAFGAGAKSCVLGSVKSNIGHTDAAAGVLGLIKVILSLANKRIPGTVHFRAPNPGLDLPGGPFTVSAASVPWPRTDRPRLAGVNALGIGGTNAHVVVQEPPAVPARPADGRPQLLPLSARSRGALAAAAQRLDTHLEHADAGLADVAWTLQTGRRHFSNRGFIVRTSEAEAARELAGHESAGRAGEGPRPVAFLFPGQGGQHVGMARELYDGEPVFRAELDLCAELAAPELGADIRDVLYPPDGDRAATERAAGAFTTMRLSQPALFAVQYALAHLWQSWGVSPSVVLGHSLGAYAAAAVAGVLSVADAMALVLLRSRLLEDLPAGAMLAVALPEEKLRPLLGGRLSIAAINSPGQAVVAGPADTVTELRDRLTAAGVDARVLRISAAAHSVLVDPVVARYEQLVHGVRLQPPTIPWISDHTGKLITDAEACDPAYWGAHLRHTVRFSDALETLLADDATVLVEIGPGRTLGSLARQHPAGNPNRPIVASLPHPVDPVSSTVTLLTAAGRLWQAGVALDWAALHHGEPRRRVPLPTYPFERQRFLLDPPDSTPSGPVGIPVARPEPAVAVFERPDTDEDFVAPTGTTEETLADAFGELLGMRSVGADDGFFDLGGDSLIAARLVAMIRERLAVEITVRDLFRAPTVRQLARKVEGETL
jgi:phthiocerol/phenolphthiocerol synthesis type-I polyketide synthase E